jgi:DNA-binding NarL/FixJ family response regulator
MQLLRSLDADVLVLDLSMPGRSGIELLKQVKSERPRLAVLVLSMHAEHQYAVRAIRAGAAGYLTKDSPSERVIEAIHKLADGGLYISTAVAELLAQNSRPASNRPPHELLSDREFQVFQCLVAGDSVSQIADKLNLSLKTISTHKAHILEKMSCASVPDLVRYAIAHDLSDAQASR